MGVDNGWGWGRGMGVNRQSPTQQGAGRAHGVRECMCQQLWVVDSGTEGAEKRHRAVAPPTKNKQTNYVLIIANRCTQKATRKGRKKTLVARTATPTPMVSLTRGT